MNAEDKEQFDFSVEHTKTQLLESGEIMPMFLAVHANGDRSLIACPWQNDQEKLQVVAMLRVMFHATDVVAYTFSCETWMKQCEGNAEMLRFDASGLTPSQCPDRIEALMVSYISYDERLMRGFRMIRDDAGKLVQLEPYADYPGEFTGRMAELLPRRGTVLPFDLRRKAREQFSRIRRKI